MVGNGRSTEFIPTRHAKHAILRHADPVPNMQNHVYFPNTFYRFDTLLFYYILLIILIGGGIKFGDLVLSIVERYLIRPFLGVSVKRDSTVINIMQSGVHSMGQHWILPLTHYNVFIA